MKSIKNLIKIVMISGLIITLNIFNTIPSFAVGNDYIYISKTAINNDGDTVVKYSDGSWYSYNNSNYKYLFKSADSDKVMNISAMNVLTLTVEEYIDKKNLKSSKVSAFRYNSMFTGFSNHSDKIYSYDLKTKNELEAYSKKWLKDNYDLNLNIPIYYDDLNYSGIFNYKKDTKTAIDIRINKEFQGMDLIIEKVLIHELTHYALFQLKRDFDDGTNEFSKECIKNGSNTNEGYIGFLKSNLECTKI